MRLHLLGLPHSQTVIDNVVCAFTAKLLKFCEMMEPLGYETVVYSGDQNDAKCTEHVQLYTSEEQARWYGELDQNVLPTVAKFDRRELPWRIFNARAVTALREHANDGEMLLVLGGNAQQPVADALGGNMLVAEWAAGYEGWFAERVCFESYAWASHCYGLRHIVDGRWYDAVIPNFFRPDDFALAESHSPSRDYLLYVGRLIHRKGIVVANEVAKAAGLPLVLAGSGSASYEGRKLTTLDGCELEDVEYLGPVGAAERNRLMSNARAVLAPSVYIEPFGAVAVEAQLCGTPAITTDWGAFPETVVQGVTGFRCRNLREFVEAVDESSDMFASDIRDLALARYSLEAVAPMYDRWLTVLADLWEGGWYALPDAKAKAA